MKPIAVFFTIAVLLSGLWFYCFGTGRSKTAGQAPDTVSTTFFVLMAAGVAAFGEEAFRAYVTVRALRARMRLLKRRIKTEGQKVAENQQNIIGVEERGFAYDEIVARNDAAHRIARDHARAKQSPNH